MSFCSFIHEVQDTEVQDISKTKDSKTLDQKTPPGAARMVLSPSQLTSRAPNILNYIIG